LEANAWIGVVLSGVLALGVATFLGLLVVGAVKQIKKGGK
jgi:hypothetical protein